MKNNPLAPPIPETRAELIKLFGNPQGSTGQIVRGWENVHIVRVMLPASVKTNYSGETVRQIQVHSRLERLTRLLYEEIWDEKLVAALGPYGGGFRYRRNVNSPDNLSTHSWGISWDWGELPEFRNGSREKRDPQLVATFARYGWCAGQDFGTPDPMHFEYSVRGI